MTLSSAPSEKTEKYSYEEKNNYHNYSINSAMLSTFEIIITRYKKVPLKELVKHYKIDILATVLEFIL
jgi:hypothetical protein